MFRFQENDRMEIRLSCGFGCGKSGSPRTDCPSEVQRKESQGEEMKYILQVFTGSWNQANVQPEEIIRTIEETASLIPVEKVIIGWNTDPSVYRKTGQFLHESGIRMLLWLPVFAEIGEIAGQDEALDLFGKNVPSPAGTGAESFRFGCISSRNNTRLVMDVFEKFFSGCGFDGVFLDRIRSQSFVSGIPGVLSCGCERCRKAFLERGSDLDQVRRRYEESGDAFFDAETFPMNGEFILRDPLAQRFFDVKEELIADAVNEIVCDFRNRGMTVGLDLFAPVVSRFVGQKYSKIAKNADFIKPMLYRRTEAPAGIGYEYSLFRKCLPGAKGWRNQLPGDRAFLNTQLEAIRSAPCPGYPGIEINYDEQLVRTDADYLKESLDAIRAYGFEGAALCWDIMRAPPSHIQSIRDMG